MKNAWTWIALGTTIVLSACATHGNHASGSNQFYGEVKAGYEASHTRY
ncbi:hypothetical protein [Snodgrassella sp. CFCC 13594]|nr:hypothetical protein [Snodgrassella sp. CFCC 13594]